MLEKYSGTFDEFFIDNTIMPPTSNSPLDWDKFRRFLQRLEITQIFYNNCHVPQPLFSVLQEVNNHIWSLVANTSAAGRIDATTFTNVTSDIEASSYQPACDPETTDLFVQSQPQLAASQPHSEINNNVAAPASSRAHTNHDDDDVVEFNSDHECDSSNQDGDFDTATDYDDTRSHYSRTSSPEPRQGHFVGVITSAHTATTASFNRA